MNKPAPQLSVIIPAYNEAGSVSRGVLSGVVEYLKHQKYTWELIVVNDGSNDNTGELLDQFAANRAGIRIINAPHQGKAASIMTGAGLARGEYLLFSDMDQATPISEVELVLPKLKDGFDVVIGSRSNRQGAPLYRQVLAYGMVVCRTLLLRLPFRDTQCGFKAFTKKAAVGIFSVLEPLYASRRQLSGAAVNPGFDVELLYLARKKGYKISEVPVHWVHHKSERVRFFKDAISGIRELLTVRWRSLTDTYGKD